MSTHTDSASESIPPPHRLAEQLSLLLSVATNGDRGQLLELAADVPKTTWSVPDTLPLMLALREVAQRDRTERLELAATLWQTAYGSARLAAGDGSMAGMDILLRIYGYYLITFAAGWRLFLAGRRISLAAADGITATMLGTATLHAAEKSAASMQVTAEEVTECYQAAFPGAKVVLTPELRAESLEALYQTQLATWSGFSAK